LDQETFKLIVKMLKHFAALSKMFKRPI